MRIKTIFKLYNNSQPDVFYFRVLVACKCDATVRLKSRRFVFRSVFIDRDEQKYTSAEKHSERSVLW